MKRLLTHQAIFDMNRALHTAKFSGRISTKFRYALRRNIDATDSEVQAMVDGFKPDDEYLEYHKKLEALCDEYKITDIDDAKLANPQILALEPKKRAEFTKKQTDLGDEYKDGLERQHDIDVELSKFMKEKIDIDLVMVAVDEMPESIDNPNGFMLFNWLYPMIIPAEEDTSKLKNVPHEYKG